MIQKKSPASGATGDRGDRLDEHTVSSFSDFVKPSIADFPQGANSAPWHNSKITGDLSLNTQQPGEGKKICLSLESLENIRSRYRLRMYSQNFLKAIGVISETDQYFSCRRFRVKKYAVLARSWSTGRGAIRNLAQCASVWACPTCSPVIQHFRSQEITHAVGKHYSTGGTTLFLTLTNPHNRDQALSYLWQTQKKALDKLWSAHTWKNKIRPLISYVGRITGTEVTYGDPTSSNTNGWHVHQHIILFCERTFSPEEIKLISSMFSSLWLDCLLNVGLCKKTIKAKEEALKHSAKIELVLKADHYLTKFSNEIGKPNSKFGRKEDRYTPFEILFSAEQGNAWAKTAWKKYYLATKGKRQLVWSDGLKSRFNVKEYTDSELASWRAASDLENLFGFRDWQMIRNIPDAESILEHAISSGRYELIRSFFTDHNIELISDKAYLDYLTDSPPMRDGGLSYEEFKDKEQGHSWNRKN